MQIRRILLNSFILLVFAVAIPLIALSYISLKSTLQEEIGHHLTSDATMLMEQVDMMMFERFQTIHTWSHQDIFQEGRIGDVDKRLSQFLTGVATSYKGIYSKLFYVDTEQRIVAANKPELLGQAYKPAGQSINVKVPNGEVFIEGLQLSPPPYESANLVIRAPIHDHYASQDIGQFYGLFDMQQIFQLLDKASSANSGSRHIVLLDAKGKVIAASSSLRQAKLLLQPTFADWKPLQDKGYFVHSGDPVTNSTVLVGQAASSGFLGYAHMGWSILVFQSTATAFLPIHKLTFLFAVVVILTMVLAFMVARKITGHIAKPLLDLANWVSHLNPFEAQKLPQVGGTIEIQALESAFGNMLQVLGHSREQVIKASKLAVIGEMAAIMAHEVRTPLSIVSTSAQWLQKEQGLSPEGKEMAQFILDESARLRQLVTTLLECARPKAPQLLPHNLHDIINHSIGLLAQQVETKQLHIEKQLYARNPLLVCDADLLTQVLLNLLLNAIQIVPESGTIRITSVLLGDYLQVDIADNGPGIAVEDYSRLFDPFFTKREGGVGLGLTVTQQIVLAHRGSITAQPSVLGGACFIFQLPTTQE